MNEPGRLDEMLGAIQPRAEASEQEEHAPARTQVPPRAPASSTEATGNPEVRLPDTQIEPPDAKRREDDERLRRGRGANCRNGSVKT